MLVLLTQLTPPNVERLPMQRRRVVVLASLRQQGGQIGHRLQRQLVLVTERALPPQVGIMEQSPSLAVLTRPLEERAEQIGRHECLLVLCAQRSTLHLERLGVEPARLVVLA